MPENVTPPPSPERASERLSKIEKELELLAKGLQRAAEEIESEWGEEIIPAGTEIRGVRF